VDLEVARAHRRRHAGRLAPGFREGARDLRLARSEETKDSVRRRQGLCEHAPNGLRLEGTWPQTLQLRRRPGQEHDYGLARLQHEPGRRPGETKGHGPFRERRLLAHARLEVRIRAPQALGKGSRDALDLGLEALVDAQRKACRARDELDRPVVVGGPQAARDDAEVGAQALRKCSLELLLGVSDDRDARRLEPEADELAREERPVAIVSTAADELAAGDDDVATQTRRCRAR
jgi:hypothetical protein